MDEGGQGGQVCEFVAGLLRQVIGWLFLRTVPFGVHPVGDRTCCLDLKSHVGSTTVLFLLAVFSAHA